MSERELKESFKAKSDILKLLIHREGENGKRIKGGETQRRRRQIEIKSNTEREGRIN